MKFTLRTRLALMYGALVALTAVIFAVVAYYTVSNELYANLDASLSRAGTSLLAVIRKEQQSVNTPLAPVKRGREKRPFNVFEFLSRSSLRNFVGPIPVPAANSTADQDPVWSAVYEHMLLNSSSYMFQVVDPKGVLVWRSDNMLTDSMPTFESLESQGAPIVDDWIFTYYTLRGTRYRLVVTRTETAQIAAAYPAAEVDATLRSLFALMLYAIPFLILISVVVGWFLARGSLKPVDVITQSARRITAEHLSQRLPMPPTNDEIARLTQTLNDMIARLEASFTQIRQFTSDASHELKTPLAILMGELEIALRSKQTDDEVQATLHSCLEEVERLANVVQSLLDLSRAESGQELIEFKPLRFDLLTLDVCEDIAILAEPKNIEVTTSIDSDITVLGDKMRLHQLLLNVIENAVKYTMPNGKVSVQLFADGRNAVLCIMDTGIGIPGELQSKVFDRFFRVDKSRSQSVHGTGLGLSIVHWIVIAHKGSIAVDSKENVGTTFTISIPLYNDSAKDSTA
ncbi:MAG: HAMP domain-containing protein [Ignavibacteria bacterium]|nr:HAMP domain-containing protein [Ignavibacteria bacterium]